MKSQKGQYKQIVKLDLSGVESEGEKEFKKICCPSCQKDIEADNINLQNKVGKCGNCNVIFSIEDVVRSLSTKQKVKQEFLRPEGIDLFHFKENLDISIEQHIQGVIVFGLIVFPPFAILSALLSWAEGFSFLIPIILALISIFLIYKAINFSKNKTLIEINDKYLNIKSRPKNFTQDKSYLSNEIDQVYIKNLGTGYFHVNIIVNSLEGQQHKKLLSVNSISKAKYLEQEIEQYLNIVDKPVPESNA